MARRPDVGGYRTRIFIRFDFSKYEFNSLTLPFGVSAFS